MEQRLAGRPNPAGAGRNLIFKPSLFPHFPFYAEIDFSTHLPQFFFISQ
jgi:hypothetical protein